MKPEPTAQPMMVRVGIILSATAQHRDINGTLTLSEEGEHNTRQYGIDLKFVSPGRYVLTLEDKRIQRKRITKNRTEGDKEKRSEVGSLEPTLEIMMGFDKQSIEQAMRVLDAQKLRYPHLLLSMIAYALGDSIQEIEDRLKHKPDVSINNVGKLPIKRPDLQKAIRGILKTKP